MKQLIIRLLNAPIPQGITFTYFDPKSWDKVRYEDINSLNEDQLFDLGMLICDSFRKWKSQLKDPNDSQGFYIDYIKEIENLTDQHFID